MLSNTKRQAITNLCKLGDASARIRAVSAYRRAVVDGGHEDWEGMQAAFLAAYAPKDPERWRWDTEVTTRHESKPIFGYVLRIGVLLGVPGAEGYGWHSVHSCRPITSTKAGEHMRDLAIARMKELCGLAFRGQTSLGFL